MEPEGEDRTAKGKSGLSAKIKKKRKSRKLLSKAMNLFLLFNDDKSACDEE